MANTLPSRFLAGFAEPFRIRSQQCRSRGFSVSGLDAFTGEWRVVAALGERFGCYGRHPRISVAVNADCSLRLRERLASRFDIRRLWSAGRRLDGIWRSADGGACILGRVERGEALILSRSGSIENEILFEQINRLRSRGFRLTHLTFPEQRGQGA